MQVQPIDVTAVVAVIMGISIVLIPILGLTARFALKPTAEALSRFFDRRGYEETVSLLERRVALLEQQLEGLESSVQRLEEVSEFDARLRGKTSGGEGELPPAPDGDQV